MRKLIIGIVGLVCSFSSAPVMAATSVPKSLCLGWSVFSGISILAIKSTGTVKTASGAVKFYSILGHENVAGLEHPVHGTGYIVPATTVFHATLNGAFVAGPSPSRWAETVELFFDLATGTGAIIYHYENLAGFKITGEAAIATGTCSSLVMSAVTVGEGERNPFVE